MKKVMHSLMAGLMIGMAGWGVTTLGGCPVGLVSCRLNPLACSELIPEAEAEAVEVF